MTHTSPTVAGSDCIADWYAWSSAPPPDPSDVEGEGGWFHAPALQELADAMRVRGWECDRATEECDPSAEMALLCPLDACGDFSRVEVVVITDPATLPGGGVLVTDGPFFANANTPTRPIAPVAG